MKPSERIVEIGKQLIKEKHNIYYEGGKYMSFREILDLRVESITLYLDEEHAKECQHVVEKKEIE